MVPEMVPTVEPFGIVSLSQSFARFLWSQVPSHLQRFDRGLLVNLSSELFLLRAILDPGRSDDKFIHCWRLRLPSGIGQNFIKTEMCIPRSDTNGFPKNTPGVWGLLGGIYRK